MNDSKIFFDPTGKRAKIIAVLLLVLVTSIIVFSYIFLPKTLNGPVPAAYQSTMLGASMNKNTLSGLNDTSRESLTDALRSKNISIIGNGPLVRVVQLEKNGNGTQAVDLQTKDVTKVLDQKETQRLEGQTHAIERYGAGNNKQISLTFDDGPDPKYSPLILDELARQKMPSSFFVTGKNVIQEEEIANRMVREGHVLANHTFNHIDYNVVSSDVGSQEIIQTQRAIRSTTSHETSFFRIPYGGDNDQSMRDNIRAIVEAQRLGYIVTSYDFDTNDWDSSRSTDIPIPNLNGSENIVMLLHDAGGDRTNTVAYVKKLGEEARKKGYSFVNLNQMYAQSSPLFAPISPTVEDKVTQTASEAIYLWPLSTIKILFGLTVFSVLFGLIINTILALLQYRKTAHKRRKNNYAPLVSVLVPAYNESKVIERTVKSLLRSSYRKMEVIIINDGSTDDTKPVGKRLAKKYNRVRFISQTNAGKSAALNFGVQKAKGEIIICVDADTLFPAATVTRLIKHFSDPKVGAVAGSVKVGNTSNLVTRWQALEYTISIHLERTAQAYLNAIMIVPGACGAWRKDAVVTAGGYSDNTLAEDCDLTLSIQEAGYTIIQDNSAVGYTEAPEKMNILAKQRYRWIFGNMQSFWKHRRMVFNRSYGWLGFFVMPYAVFNIIMPIIFIPVLTFLAIINILNGQYLTLLFFAGITLLIQFAASVISIVLAKERLSLLWAVPFTRIVYSPLKTYLMYKSVVTIARGSNVTWNKFGRTGAVASLVLLTRQAKKAQAT